MQHIEVQRSLVKAAGFMVRINHISLGLVQLVVCLTLFINGVHWLLGQANF